MWVKELIQQHICDTRDALERAGIAIVKYEDFIPDRADDLLKLRQQIRDGMHLLDTVYKEISNKGTTQLRS